METSPQTNPVSSLYKVKDATIFLGILYCITFVLLLPILIKYSDSAPTLLQMSLFSLLCVVLVHLLFNWLYYLVIAIPLIISGLIFILGWAMYIYAPLCTGIIMLIFSIFSSALSVLGVFDLDTSWIGYITSFIEHLGQFFIAIGGIFWWFVQKGESIKYRALYVYLVFLVFVGAQLGIGGLQNIFYFLFIWLLLYLKISGVDDIKQNIKSITVLFRLGASIVVMAGITGAKLVGTGLSARLMFEFGNSNALSSNFYTTYQNIILILLLFGIWTPQSTIKKILPKQVQEKVGSFYRFLLSKADLFQIKI